MKNIVILCASVGNNLALANKLSTIATKLKINTEIINLVELNLPLYHTEEEKKGVPSVAQELKEKIKSSLGLIVIAPEYNGLIPPVLNNAIAWVSRTGDDWREAFNGRVTAIATHSGGGGAHALMAMRQQLSYIGAVVLGRQLLTNYSKELNDESAIFILNEIKRLGES
ncbi:MAG: NAD(P)H-dependent oxidoreductase [Halobacteriovoraceae bacterium]|nr:NAD(P)H-dependent oxidoreductase [Halobacteriovoraceae bacterium]MCB9095290.1 NAD(P)H-dependent oxidoreductase [Halobacteriovoraceae bacterium]